MMWENAGGVYPLATIEDERAVQPSVRQILDSMCVSAGVNYREAAPEDPAAHTKCGVLGLSSNMAKTASGSAPETCW